MIKSQNTTENKIRVGMVSISFYPTFSGAGTQAWRLCQKLVQKGVQIVVLAENTDNSTRRETIGNILVWRLPKRGHGRPGALVFAARMFCHLIKHRRRYNLLHVHGAYWYSQVVILAGKLLHKKSIIKMTLIGDDDPLSIRDRQLFGRLGFRILGMADRINCISQELTESYRSSGLPMDKLAEIPNGVDTQQFCPVSSEEKQKIRQHLGLPQYEPIVTFTGEICHRKGLDILINAWGEVALELPSARLLLIGPNNDNLEDSYVRGLHHQINELKLANKVFFTGQVNNINQYLQASDVLAFPSRRDSTPSAILEAMASGLPCVVMETAGVSRPLVNGVNGLIFDAEDSQQMARHILRLLHEPPYAHRLGQEARKTVLANFSLDSVAERYLELYTRLLSKR